VQESERNSEYWQFADNYGDVGSFYFKLKPKSFNYFCPSLEFQLYKRPMSSKDGAKLELIKQSTEHW
jgi:hypothetical protein